MHKKGSFIRSMQSLASPHLRFVSDNNIYTILQPTGAIEGINVTKVPLIIFANVTRNISHE